MGLELGLTGKIAAVSGGSAGLGRAMAYSLAREGANVAICARGREALEQTAAELNAEVSGEVFPIVADMTSAEDCQRFVEETVEHFGGLDIIINNTGTHAAYPFEEIDDELWHFDFEQKFFSAVRCTRAAIPHLRARGGGRILNITHVTAKAPRAQSLPTVASRSAGMAFTKVLSREYAHENILSNTICIGAVKTSQWERAHQEQAPDKTLDEFYDDLAQKREIPLGHFGNADELGDLAAFLVSERASYITGSSINFDGGSSWTL